MGANKVYLGIFLISLATLSLEVSLIRFFSISQWYHFAFMVVSIALFGIAASGTFLAIRRIKNPLYISSVGFSISVLGGFFAANQLSFDPYKAVLDPAHVLVLPIYYLLLGLPFFFFGIIIAYSFTKFQSNAGKVYFYNLSGSAIGTLAALFFISYLGTKAIVGISLIGLVAALFFNSKATKLVGLLFAVHLVLLFIPLSMSISPYKELSQALNVPGSELIETRQNSFSRVDVVQSSFTRYAPGLSAGLNISLPDQIGVTVDAGNMNAISRHENLAFVKHLPSSIPYSLTKRRKTLVINPGAGLDVLAALEHNATVSAVEENPILIDLVEGEYSDYSGNIYNRADVVWSSGRGYLKANKEKYDIIVLSISGNVLSAGISGLSENYLLTREAFEDYRSSLSDGGVLVVTRWLLFPPRESLRLFSLALEVDKEAEATALFRSLSTVTLVVGKNDFDQETIESIRQFCAENKFDIIYLPSEFTPNRYLRFKEPYYYDAVQGLLSNDAFYDSYLFDVSAVTDEKPFYHNFFKPSKMRELYKAMGQKWNPFFDSGFLTFFILVQAVVLAVVFILLPICFRRGAEGMKLQLWYFFAIGLSYLFIEIVFIQKFVLFLGHIIFASSTVLFSMLLFSGFGALYSQRIRHPRAALLLLSLCVFGYVFLIDFVFKLFISLNLYIKIALSVAVLAPLGFMMGFPFPLGISRIKKGSVAWAWAVNGSASVLSPIMAILIALFFGYNLVLVLAAGLYLIAILLRPCQ